MVRFLIRSLDMVIEVALWGLFLVAALAGYAMNGVMGALVAVIVAFLLSVFLIAPVMMISDIRRTLARIETGRNATPSIAAASNVMPSEPARQNPASAEGAPASSNRIKVYKGYEMTRANPGVAVGGQTFENVLAAEKWVNEQIKSA